MKSRETLIRLKKFQVDEKRRKVMQIEGMIAEFDRMAADLDREILAEQERAGIHDPAHFAYPTYAKAALNRRDNLKRSADDLKGQLEDARAALAEAFEELKKVELLDERDQMRERAGEQMREQAELDRIGLMRHRDAVGPWGAAPLPTIFPPKRTRGGPLRPAIMLPVADMRPPVLAGAGWGQSCRGHNPRSSRRHIWPSSSAPLPRAMMRR